MGTTTRRHTLAGSLGLLGTGLLHRVGAAAGWPERAITVAMTAPAGGATDIGTRPMLESMRRILGAPAIATQDMSGAGGVQALDYVQRQPTDGYTWAGMSDIIEAYPSLGRTDYDWRAFDFWMSGGTACGIVVPAKSGIERFDQLLDAIKTKPDHYSIASTPSGTLWSNVAVYLKQKLGLSFRLANYKGGGPAIRAVLSGETNFGCMGVTPMVPFLQSGELRCLAAWTKEDWQTAGTVLPSVTRFIQDPLMVKTLPWTNIHGIALRKGVDEAILRRIDDAFAEAMRDPKMKEIDDDNAFFPFHMGRDRANILMGERTALQAFIIEAVLGTHKKTREELGIPKLEETLS